MNITMSVGLTVIVGSLALSGVLLWVLVLAGLIKGLMHSKADRLREQRLADEWKARHRAHGDPSPFNARHYRDGK